MHTLLKLKICCESKRSSYRVALLLKKYYCNLFTDESINYYLIPNNKFGMHPFLHMYHKNKSSETHFVTTAQS